MDGNVTIETLQERLAELQRKLENANVGLITMEAKIKALQSLYEEAKPYKDLFIRFRYSRVGKLAHAVGRLKSFILNYSLRRHSSPTSENSLYRPPNPEDDEESYRRWSLRVSMGDVCVLPENGAYKPFISLVVIVCGDGLASINETLNAVFAQTYPEWEVFVVGDTAKLPDHHLFQQAGRTDPRIHIICTDNVNLISDAINGEVLRLACGEFMSLIASGDILAPNALYEIVLRLQKNRNADVIYSDEDRLREGGEIFAPFFKPDWSPRLLLSMNYIGNLTLVRRSLLVELGGYLTINRAAGIYETLLKYSVKAQNIVHIAKVLYHRRISHEKTEHVEQKIEIVRKFLESEKRAVLRVEACWGDKVRVHWAIPQPAPIVSIIIPTHDHLDLLIPCLSTLVSKTTYPAYEIIVVDHNSSEPEAVEFLNRLPCTVVRISDVQFNFSRLINEGVRQSQGDVILWLNNDTEVINSEWMTSMVGELLQPGVGAVGAQLKYPDNRIQHAGVIVGLGEVAGHAHRLYRGNEPGYCGLLQVPHEVEAVTGACLMVKRTVFYEVGGVPEEFPVNFNDIAFCLALRKKGYRIIYTPEAQLYHKESATRQLGVNPGEQELFKGLYGDIVDQYYSPNLAWVDPSYQLNWDIMGYQ